ncbi:putative Ig domain-containing protein, partial [candidate division KSB1 bacterium]|nr:putative Ig domain-containing protein [candidate division KSB1 bacterium]
MEQFNVFQKAFPAGPVVLGGNMAPGAAGAKSNYIVLIDVGGCQFVNEEFNQDSYCGFSLLIPKDGPTVGLLANPGFCRFYLPGNTKFDHWSTVNDAPRLRRAVPSDMDWSVETSLTLQNTTGSKMAAGLVIIFSEHDMLYWGFVGSSNMLNARQTRTVILSNIAYGGGNTVELLIRKQGSEYFFAYRPPGAQTWIEAGSRAVNKPPVHAGLMVKTWQTAAVTADFDYFRLMFADPLNIITDFLPGGVKGTAYNAQLQAGGGVPPYTWSETGNNLPAGLSLNAAGTISGTPAVAGTATITVQVADNAVPPNTATKQLDITITDDGTGIDEEFITGNLDGYTVYVPVPGPQWDALSVTDYLRLFIPATQNYDHWNNKDDAPQLRRDVPAGSDWSVETQTQLMAYPASGFHTGLLVYFDRFDLFYWGFN